jgi:hypothetical protein
VIVSYGRAIHVDVILNDGDSLGGDSHDPFSLLSVLESGSLFRTVT